LRTFDANRDGDSLLYRSAVLLAAGAVAFVGFAACAGMLQGRGRVRRTPLPGDALSIARKELKLLRN
jgi:hypothetical protein